MRVAALHVNFVEHAECNAVRVRCRLQAGIAWKIHTRRERKWERVLGGTWMSLRLPGSCRPN